MLSHNAAAITNGPERRLLQVVMYSTEFEFENVLGFVIGIFEIKLTN